LSQALPHPGRTINILKILVIEDEVTFAELYRIFLVSKGHTVTAAFDGQQGMDAYFRNRPFDLVITDYRMPKKDGSIIIKEILSVDPDQEIILATAYNIEKENLANNFNTANIKILKKPFDFEQLEMVIGTLKKLPA
jgi:DNA-binding NtrC family response regulator